MILGILTILAIGLEGWVVLNIKTYTRLVGKTGIKEIVSTISEQMKHVAGQRIDLNLQIQDLLTYLTIGLLELFYALAIIMMAFSGVPHNIIGATLLALSLLSIWGFRKNIVWNFIDSLCCLGLLCYSFTYQIGLIIIN